MKEMNQIINQVMDALLKEKTFKFKLHNSKFGFLLGFLYCKLGISNESLN